VADSPPRPAEAHDSARPSGTPGTGRRALGRGLGALIPGGGPAEDLGVAEISVEDIRPNARQPRSGFGPQTMAELEASIKAHGVIQPVVVRPVPGQHGKFELVAGERRWRAAASAGLRSLPAVIRHVDDRGALEAALVENLQREDLNAIERARAYRHLAEEFGLTQEAIAERVGSSQSAVANTLRLLSLPAEIQAAVEAGRVSEGHARALLAVQDHRKMIELWRQVEKRGLSVRAVEVLARRSAISREMPERTRRGGTREVNIIEQKAADMLGAPVKIIVKGRGAGEIRITFFSPEDLDRLLERLEGGRLA
jgi:ParB family chromosome partitioning protein